MVTDRTGFRIAVIFGLGVMGAMTVSEAVTELSAIAREFHPGNPSTIGLVMSLPSLVVAVGALVAGYIVDRVGDRPVLLAGATLAILGDICVMLAPSLDVVLAARLLNGLGYVLITVSAITVMMRITSGKQRTMALALWSTFVPASFILPFMTAGIAAAFGNWRAAFGSHASITALLLVLAVLCLPARDAEAAQPSRTAGLLAVLRTPRPYLLGLSFGANAFLLSGIVASLAPYLARHYGANELEVQHWNIVAMLADIAGCLLVGRSLNRGVSGTAIGLAGIGLTVVPAAALYGLPLGIAGSIVASWIFTFGSGLLVGMWTLVPYCAPSPKSLGATSGLVTQVTLVGVLLGTPLSFAAQAAASPLPMVALVVVGSLVCLAAGLPIWMLAGAPQTRSAAFSAAK